VQDRIVSNGVRLAAHLARPPGMEPGTPMPGLVICHGFPAGPRGAASSAQTYPELADRIAADAGWIVLTYNFRGTGASEGDFSLAGWLTDVRAAVDHLDGMDDVQDVWVCGASTGGSLAICAAADDDRIRGVATLAARADFEDWAQHPKRFLDHARRIGVVRSRDFPADLDEWIRELSDVRPVEMVTKLAPRPLLLIHGSEDELVPTTDARLLGDAHGDAELRIVTGGGHRLRHDPRAIAVLLGWLDRQKPAADGTLST